MSASIAAAIAHAQATKAWAKGMCDNFVASMYGYSSSGYDTAVDNWNATPAALRSPGNPNPPVGSLAYFSRGSGPGHVALVAGPGGQLISTDINGPGTVGETSIATIVNHWHMNYLGSATPYFQGGPAVAGPMTSQATGGATATNVLDVNPGDWVSGFVSGLQNDLLTAVVYLGALATAAGLIIAGALHMAHTQPDTQGASA